MFRVAVLVNWIIYAREVRKEDTLYPLHVEM